MTWWHTGLWPLSYDGPDVWGGLPGGRAVSSHSASVTLESENEACLNQEWKNWSRWERSLHITLVDNELSREKGRGPWCPKFKVSRRVRLPLWGTWELKGLSPVSFSSQAQVHILVTYLPLRINVGDWPSLFLFLLTIAWSPSWRAPGYSQRMKPFIWSLIVGTGPGRGAWASAAVFLPHWGLLWRK